MRLNPNDLKKFSVQSIVSRHKSFHFFLFLLSKKIFLFGSRLTFFSRFFRDLYVLINSWIYIKLEKKYLFIQVENILSVIFFLEKIFWWSLKNYAENLLLIFMRFPMWEFTALWKLLIHYNSQWIKIRWKSRINLINFILHWLINLTSLKYHK